MRQPGRAPAAVWAAQPPRPAGAAPAAIFCRAADLKEPDAIYGGVLGATWKLLDELARTEGGGKTARRIVDFGFSALQAQLDALDAEKEKVMPCLARRR